MRLHPMRTKPARQPEAVSTGFEGQCNPRDLAAGLDRLVTPAMQQAKQPFCTRLQLLAWLALNAGKHTGNQPTRLAHLDDGNDRAILVQGDEGPAQSLPRRRPGSFGWGIRALHQLATATMVPFPRRLPHTNPYEGFPENARWNAERQAVEFGVEIGEYRGMVRVPRRVFQRLLPERPTGSAVR